MERCRETEPPPIPFPPSGSNVAVLGGSVHGGNVAAVVAICGGKVVAEGAVLEARPVEGQQMGCAAALAMERGAMIQLQRCELRTPSPQRPTSARQRPPAHSSLVVQAGAKAIATDCRCSGRVEVWDPGSTLLHSGLAFRPGLGDTIVAVDGGVARELPAAAGRAGGSRAAAGEPAAAPP
jgi:hypothetical protein